MEHLNVARQVDDQRRQRNGRACQAGGQTAAVPALESVRQATAYRWPEPEAAGEIFGHLAVCHDGTANLRRVSHEAAQCPHAAKQTPVAGEAGVDPAQRRDPRAAQNRRQVGAERDLFTAGLGGSVVVGRSPCAAAAVLASRRRELCLSDSSRRCCCS
jgi:hypothetical protein